MEEWFAYQCEEDGRCDVRSQRLIQATFGGERPDLSGYRTFRPDPRQLREVEAACDDQQVEKACGALAGLLVGDALGQPVEFEPLRYGARDVTGMGSGYQGAFSLKPGQWTDDGSQALCLADSLLIRGTWDPIDAMLRILAWWHFGYNAVYGRDPSPFSPTAVGLGTTVAEALDMFQFLGEAYTSTGDSNTSGAGAIMRLAPVAIAAGDSEQAAEWGRWSSRTTHRGDESAECAALLAWLIAKLLNSAPGDRSAIDRLPDAPVRHGSVRALAESRGEGGDPDRNWNWRVEDYRYSPARAKAKPGYVGGYAMDGLCMALHCVHATDTFEEAVLRAVNLRGDADTVGAITGQVAGALYGLDGIPDEWINAVEEWDQGEARWKAYRLLHLLQA